MSRSFGPIVYHEPDGSFRASCEWCALRGYMDRHVCNYGNRVRPLPDIKNTPEWCEMRADMLDDARKAAAAKGDAA